MASVAYAGAAAVAILVLGTFSVWTARSPNRRRFVTRLIVSLFFGSTLLTGLAVLTWLGGLSDTREGQMRYILLGLFSYWTGIYFLALFREEREE